MKCLLLKVDKNPILYKKIYREYLKEIEKLLDILDENVNIINESNYEEF